MFSIKWLNVSDFRYMVIVLMLRHYLQLFLYHVFMTITNLYNQVPKRRLALIIAYEYIHLRIVLLLMTLYTLKLMV